MAANPNSLAAQYFDFSCPDQDGGLFYICEGSDNEFIGCCTSNPCANSSGLCPDGHLRTSSFAADRSASLLTQSCDDSRGSHVWYKCENIEPPFMGCCNESPCGSGCDRDMLLPAVLSKLQKNREAFLAPSSASSSTASTSTATSSSKSDSDSGSSLSTGAVAGIAAGSAAVGVLILAFVAWRCWWNAQKRKQQQGMQFQPVASNQMGGHMQGEYMADQTPLGYYQNSFASTPTAMPYQYDKHSPHGQSIPMNTMSGQYGQMYAPGHMMPAQEMEGAYPAPQELSAGHHGQDTHQGQQEYFRDDDMPYTQGHQQGQDVHHSQSQEAQRDLDEIQPIQNQSPVMSMSTSRSPPPHIPTPSDIPTRDQSPAVSQAAVRNQSPAVNPPPP